MTPDTIIQIITNTLINKRPNHPSGNLRRRPTPLQQAQEYIRKLQVYDYEAEEQKTYAMFKLGELLKDTPKALAERTLGVTRMHYTTATRIFKLFKDFPEAILNCGEISINEYYYLTKAQFEDTQNTIKAILALNGYHPRMGPDQVVPRQQIYPLENVEQ